LARSRFWPQLRWLDLAGNPIGDTGAKQLLAAEAPPQLWTLFLWKCGISEPLQEALKKRYGDRVAC
jgi:hypothetical protein